MARSEVAQRLTDAHYSAQLAIARQTVSGVVALWPLLNAEDIDGSLERWLLASLPLVERDRLRSARTAQTYFATYRALELGEAPATAFIDTKVPIEAIRTSLIVTGPVRIKNALTKGRDLVQALNVAQRSTASAAMRHALDGGRETISGGVTSDSRALGYARVVRSANPCAFCKMLASRGPVYSKETGTFQAHDKCSCSLEPVYFRDAPWPDERAYIWREQWNESTQGFSGKDAINAFRRSQTA